jgi:hypothetical protein
MAGVGGHAECGGDGWQRSRADLQQVVARLRPHLTDCEHWRNHMALVLSQPVQRICGREPYLGRAIVLQAFDERQ